jgi:hypothetical protein
MNDTPFCGISLINPKDLKRLQEMALKEIEEESKMTFSEALKLLKYGYQLRRKSWHLAKYAKLSNGQIKCMIKTFVYKGDYELDKSLTHEDILATDWELFK